MNVEKSHLLLPMKAKPFFSVVAFEIDLF